MSWARSWHDERKITITVLVHIIIRHWCKCFWKLVKSNRNQIVFIIFRLIWYQTAVRVVPNESENGKYNLILVDLTRFRAALTAALVFKSERCSVLLRWIKSHLIRIKKIEILRVVIFEILIFWKSTRREKIVFRLILLRVSEAREVFFLSVYW